MNYNREMEYPFLYHSLKWKLYQKVKDYKLKTKDLKRDGGGRESMFKTAISQRCGFFFWKQILLMGDFL